MTAQDATTHNRFALENFAPGWGAVVMGTGALSGVFHALANLGFSPETTTAAARVFLIMALLISLPILGIVGARWIRFSTTVFAEMSHPVKGGMTATFPGGILVLAVAIGRDGPWLFGEQVALILAGILTALGGLLALALGFVYLAGSFVRGNIAPQMITGAMFIPPVVTILVPTALYPLLISGGVLASELLWVSWVILGIGGMLYVVVVAALFFRSATAPLPPAQLAPTLFIGMSPAGLMSLNLYLLADAGMQLGITGGALVDVALAAGIMIWGFGFWWGITAYIVLVWGYRKLPFTLSWWGFTFPLAAWVTAGLVLSLASGSMITGLASIGGAVVLAVVWVNVFARTVRGIVRGTIWE